MKLDSPLPGKKVLFVVNEAGEFVELRRVALAAKLAGYDVNFLFTHASYINLKPDRAFCRLNGFTAYYPGRSLKRSPLTIKYEKIAQGLENGYIPHSLVQKTTPKGGALTWAGLILTTALSPFFKLHDTATDALQKSRKKANGNNFKPFNYARLLYKLLKPSVVVFGQEFPGSVNTLLTKICNKDNVPTLIIPFAVGTAKEMVESLSDKPMYEADRNILNKLAAFLFPHWVNYYASKKLLRLPGQRIFFLEAFGFAPEHPWIPNNSSVTCIGVESPEMERYYRRMRFPEQQLRLTGAAYDDVMHAARESKTARERVFRRLRLDPAKPLLVCAWPTDQYGSRSIPMEFSDYKALCKAWAKALASVSRSTDFNVIIRPHPVTDPEFLSEILRPYRLHNRVTDIDTLELVPACDLFVACVSSTLRWATACGIPAINYDCYDYGYTDFENAKGLVTTNRYSVFQSTLEQLTDDKEAYARARANQIECAHEWGLHDGKSMERIIDLLDELTSAQPLSTPSART